VLSLYQLQVSVIAGLLVPLAGAAGEDGLTTGYRWTFAIAGLAVVPLLFLWLRSHRPLPAVVIDPLPAALAEHSVAAERLSHP
jgi:hypothetical protein